MEEDSRQHEVWRGCYWMLLARFTVRKDLRNLHLGQKSQCQMNIDKEMVPKESRATREKPRVLY